MQYPLIVCDQNTLYSAGPDFFTSPYTLDEVDRVFVTSVGRLGGAYFSRFMENDGTLHMLVSQGLTPCTLWQKLGLVRRKEKYILLPPRKVTVRELTQLISGLDDKFKEAPCVADLKACLSKKIKI
jgi:hypothetical protein